MKKRVIHGKFMVTGLAILLSACGGGGTSSTLSGTAATGAALAGASVEIKDVNGKTGMATTTVDGGYKLNIDGLTGPFLIKATGIDGTTVYSAALPSDTNGVINATPLTSIIVASATGKSPDSLYAAYGSSDASALTQNLSSAITAFTGAFANIGTALGFTVTDAGLLRGVMNTDHQGWDGVLDTLNISFTGTTVTITDKDSNVLGRADLSSAPLGAITINAGIASTLTKYANATAGIASLLATMTTDCGHPVANDVSDEVYSQTCTDHTSDAFLNEGIKNAAIFSSGMGQLARNNATIVFKNPVILGFDADNGYQARYDYVVSAGGKTQIFESEGYFKDESGNGDWKFRGDQQYIGLDTNIERSYSTSSKNNLNTFKLFAVTGAASWSDVQYKGQSIDYVVVKGPGLPDNGLTLSEHTQAPDDDNTDNTDTALYACIGIQGNNNTPCYDPEKSDYGSATQDGITFTAPANIAPENDIVSPANMKRYTFTAYHGDVGTGRELYTAPYWLPLRYEYSLEN